MSDSALFTHPYATAFGIGAMWALGNAVGSLIVITVKAIFAAPADRPRVDAQRFERPRGIDE